MRRAKQTLGVLLLAGIWLFASYELFAVFTRGEIYSRHHGWVLVREHPVLTAATIVVQGSIVLAPAIVAGLMLWLRPPPRRGFSRFDIDQAKREPKVR